MKIPIQLAPSVLTIVLGFSLSACSNGPAAPEGSKEVREQLAALQADPNLAGRALLAQEEARAAVADAEKPREDEQVAEHYVYIAEKKVGIAQEQAKSEWLKEQRKTLSTEAQLKMRDNQLNTIRSEAKQAQMDVESARSEAEQAKMEAQALKEQQLLMQQEMEALNAKPTDRGMVLTLGDVLFETGKSDIKAGATNKLSKLAEFLKEYPDRSAIIEGHTDNVGSDSLNQGLSQQRADSVRNFLTSQGIEGTRLTASGKGEYAPIADNETALGRQQNRRVEVIISNPPKQSENSSPNAEESMSNTQQAPSTGAIN
ncbi:MAG: OmpA family protein [Pseudomonadota bacterium]